MKKPKLVLTTKTKKDDVYVVVKENGDLSVCVTMALQYIAENIVEQGASIKEVTKLLKDMVKNEQERRGNGEWL